jgi:GTPase SAR1 family protein
MILAGPPGVGKTTLANMLLYTHLEKGYGATVIQRDVQEGQKLFQEGERQIFYFDDFMGSTFLGTAYRPTIETRIGPSWTSWRWCALHRRHGSS